MVKIFHPDQVKKLDEYTIKHEPIPSIDLMERAAQAAVDRMQAFELLHKNYTFHIFCGPGNNGGDGLAMSRILSELGFSVKTYSFKYNSTSVDYTTNKERLPQELIHLDQNFTFDFTENDVLIDCLFGIGLSRPLEGEVAKLISSLNEQKGFKIAIDIASGLYASKSSKGVLAFEADLTLSFQFPKLAYLMPENAQIVGHWEVVSIGIHPEALATEQTDFHLLEENDVSGMIISRDEFSHKGDFGKALIMAGSKGKMGAAVMAAKASLRTGLGLLNMHVPERGEVVLQTTVLEAMVEADPNPNFLTELQDLSPYQAIAVGPGIGAQKETVILMQQLLQKAKVPLLIDADGLNIIAKNQSFLQCIPKNSILTPHPKEFERLAGKWANDFERLEKLQKFAKDHSIYVILKGKFTSIATPEGVVYFNPTGNVGMATGGSGDVLSGMLTALMAQGYTSKEACLLGVYLHGLAGDITADHLGIISMLPTDLIECIPLAFEELGA